MEPSLFSSRLCTADSEEIDGAVRNTDALQSWTALRLHAAEGLHVPCAGRILIGNHQVVMAKCHVRGKRGVFLNFDDHVIRKSHESLNIRGHFLHVQSRGHSLRL